MAELVGGALLSGFLDVLFERMASNEIVEFFQGKKFILKLLEELEIRLNSANVLLNDAEERQLRDQNVKNWLEQLKDVIYETDHVIDKINTEALRCEIEGVGVKLMTFHPFRSSYFDRSVKVELEEILASLKLLLEQSDHLGLKKGVKRSSTVARPVAPLVEESDVCGRVDEKRTLIELLISDDVNLPKISVIPILGMGGIGKTTLAQLVYKDARVQEHFDFKVWVTVSEEFDVPRLTKVIFESITSRKCDIEDPYRIQRELKEALRGKKFLFVHDDVWNEKYELWDLLQSAFQSGAHGSKIIVTTRSDIVAKQMGNVEPYRLGVISEDDCWALFRKHVFGNVDEHSDWKEIGIQFVKKCKGLPLAVKSIAGLLRSVKSREGWREILESDIWGMEFHEVNSTNILPALWLSYSFLPPNLKRCFAFLSVFRKDYEFDGDDQEKIILMWMAEGLLQPQDNRQAEDVGKEYLNVLVSRSFFQHRWPDEPDLIMHDLIHDLALFVSGGLHSSSSKTRYVSLKETSEGSFKPFDTTFLSTLIVECHLSESILLRELVLSRGECLRALSLFRSSIKELPHSIGTLMHLRYLDLSQTRIEELPASLCSLYNLQTLLLTKCRELTCLPADLSRLIKLRHLNIEGTSLLLNFEDNPSLKNIPEDIENFFHLTYLSLRGTGVSLLPKSIGKLVNLETLDLKYTLVKELPVEINNLGKLRHLLVCSIDSKVEGLNFNRVLKGAKINKGIMRLKALQKLHFIEANAVEFDVFNDISQLTNLKKLGIRQLRSEDGRRLCDCVQKMNLIDCLDVASTSEDEPIDLESISSPPKFLRRLYLHGRLFKFPRWIEFLPSLAKIRIRWSKLEEDPLKFLQHLPNLLEIDIGYNAYCGEELRFEERSFPKLKVLYLYGLSRLKSLVIEETALPMLEFLKIGQCPLMTEVPSGLQHLRHLKEVLFQRMPRDFRNVEFVDIPTDDEMVEFDTSLKILETSIAATRKDRDLASEGTSTVTNDDWFLWPDTSLEILETSIAATRKDRDLASEGTSTVTNEDWLHWPSENELVHGSDLNIEKPKHDVFLSISSEDTRNNNFTSHLYAALRRNGITTHSYNGTESGDEISPEVVKAIQESRLCLVIFTKYYAVSSWRHNELKHILRCSETRGNHFVVPIYYDVDSSYVRERLKHYQTYFAQKKEKSPMDDSNKEHSSEVVLSKAASLPSWDSNAIRPESKLIEEIVGDIIKKLKRIPPITDLDGLVGIPDRLNHIKSWLDYDSPKVLVIGIEGMGGIGKTALAKVLFDKLSIQFEASCFIGDSREAWESGRKKYLRKKLVPGLLGKKVLIVIDDIEEEEQFELLLGDRDRYGAGSRIIVTSRHSRAIKDADSIYQMTELSPSEALLLFKLNAFRKSSFTEGLLRLSEALVNSFSNRNPLSIKLVGSVLHGKSKETWVETMGILRNVSNGEIQNVLRICYDQLEEDAKNVLLDVACFFKGSDEEFVKRILEGCWSGSIKAMKDLLEMSLITALDSKLRMHDLIEELGKTVVSEVSVIEPGQRSRLWDAKDIYKVFENDTGTDVVEAIFLDMCKIQKVEVGPTAFSRMSKLRMLKLHSHFAYCTLQFTGGDLQFLSSELRYLYWDAYPFKSMPSSFTGKKLVELRLRFSKVKQLWEITQELENLKVIDLSFSKELIAIPDLSLAGNVESVILSGCKSLSEVPLYFQHLTKLVTLDLEDCSSLGAILALPENIIQVNLARCINLKKLPADMSELKSLRRLELAGCSSFDFTNFKKFTTSS